MIIAIDGPAGSGKSTTARLVAQQLGHLYLDTGAMYRAIGLGMIRRNVIDDRDAARRVLPQLQVEMRYEGSRPRVLLNGEDVTTDIRRARAGEAASRVSAWTEVREKLVDEQRRIAREAQNQGRGVVLDGRDIGTVVFPDADVKIFMEADALVRARRRYDELVAAGADVRLDDVLEEINRRDLQDSTRAASPLRRAEDAIVIDTSRASVDEQVALVLEKVRERGRTATGRP